MNGKEEQIYEAALRKRREAMTWWQGTNLVERRVYTDRHYAARRPASLTGHEIEAMYRAL